MTCSIRQNTSHTIIIGPILDSAGLHVTNEVIENIKITKNGVVGEPDTSAILTYLHSGKYYLALTPNDFDTIGLIEISLNDGANDMAIIRFNVEEEPISLNVPTKEEIANQIRAELTTELDRIDVTISSIISSLSSTNILSLVKEKHHPIISDITINQGNDFEITVILLNNNREPMDLSGFDIVSQLKRNYSSSSAVIDFNCEKSIVNTGEITLSLNRATTKEMKVGRYAYDTISINKDTGKRTTVLSGVAFVIEGVTDIDDDSP
jgi:hypothetical protein